MNSLVSTIEAKCEAENKFSFSFSLQTIYMKNSNQASGPDMTEAVWKVLLLVFYSSSLTEKWFLNVDDSSCTVGVYNNLLFNEKSS